MELNCTHEESKKILELGYDFSSVCDRFIEELTRLKKPEYIEREYFDIVVFRSEVDQHIKDSWIPIVPHDALAKCLPDYNFTDAAGRKLSCRWYGILPVCSEAYALNDIHIHHKNACEAFIWCQEKYPDELRAKFEEVMK